MKSDLPRLMEKRGLDAFVVAGGEEYSAIRDYMTNGAAITGGLILQKRDGEPLLVVNGMEIEEGRKSGLNTRTYAELGYMDILKQEKDLDKAHILFWGNCLRAIGMEAGKIGVYGVGMINQYLEYHQMLTETYPQYQFVGEKGLTLFTEAMITKDAAEIERIKSVAERTNLVLDQTWQFIAGQALNADETVIKNDGTPLTIGDVKRFIRRALLDVELEDTHMIFAQGRDSAFPHSRGEDDQALQAGQSIIFDLFPRELGGGYHHDVTRTWSIGYAPPELQALYDDVMTAFDISMEAFGVEKPTHLMQQAVLDFFEGKGHPTARSTPGTLDGYVHTLGHGIGLSVHERPSITHLREDDTFLVGNCVTIEPGLYYPDKGIAARIEDLCIVSDSGELVSLTPFKKDLVIPIQKA